MSLCSFLERDDYAVETAEKTDDAVSYYYPTSGRVTKERGRLEKTCRGTPSVHCKLKKIHTPKPQRQWHLTVCHRDVRKSMRVELLHISDSICSGFNMSDLGVRVK